MGWKSRLILETVYALYIGLEVKCSPSDPFCKSKQLDIETLERGECPLLSRLGEGARRDPLSQHSQLTYHTPSGPHLSCHLCATISPRTTDRIDSKLKGGHTRGGLWWLILLTTHEVTPPLIKSGVGGTHLWHWHT